MQDLFTNRLARDKSERKEEEKHRVFRRCNFAFPNFTLSQCNCAIEGFKKKVGGSAATSLLLIITEKNPLTLSASMAQKEAFSSVHQIVKYFLYV